MRITGVLVCLAVVAASAQAAVLWDNGDYGAGMGIVPRDAGYDSHGIVVAGYRATNPQRNADNFAVPANEVWDLDTLNWYAYQSSTPVPFTKAYVAVYNVDPTGTTDLNPFYGGSAELNGGTATNRLLSQVDTGDDRTDTSRPITKLTLDLSWLPALPAGNYWLAIGLRGTTDTSTVASVPVKIGRELHGPNNGLAWGRTRYATPGLENFWQLADGNIPAGESPDVIQPYEYAFQLNGTATIVPEPATLGLLVLGLFGLLRRR